VQASRFERPGDLLKSVVRIEDMLHHVLGDHQVEGLSVEGLLLEVLAVTPMERARWYVWEEVGGHIAGALASELVGNGPSR
jgi:hypothetical protein